MLEFLVDNIFVVFAGKVFQQIIGIPMGTNCAPLLADKKWKSEIQIFGLSSRGTLFCKGTLWFEEQVHWRRHYQDARVSSWQHYRCLRGKGFPTDNRHSHGHKLCPSPSRHISIIVRSGIHILTAGKKRLASQFNFTYRYIDDVLSINNPDFENYLGQMYPLELQIKDTTESNTSASYLWRFEFPYYKLSVPE